MKKVISFMLAIILMISLCVSAFALSLTPTADKTSIAQGETITVTLSFDEQIEDIASAEARLYFDDTKFEFNSGVGADSYTNVVKDVKTENGKKYVQVNYFCSTVDSPIAAGKFATITFTAKQDIQGDAEFSAQVVSSMLKDENKTANTDPISLTVTITPPAPGYQVSVPKSISAGVNGETIVPVAVHLTEADGTHSASNTFNAYSFTVTYDTAKLRYKSIAPTDAEVTELGNGKLKIAGTSHHAINGSDTAFKLTFETFTAVGATKVTVSDAKIDDKANAIDKDAPLAKAGNLTTTVTVGGYSVTLPEGFEGAGSAAAGEDYTFKVTDGKAYTVTATVDGIPVPVTKNETTYTIAALYVTGKIVVAAKEKAMVTVKVDNKGDGTITGLDDGIPEGEDVTFTVTSPLDKNPIAYTVKVGEVEIAASGVEIADQKGPRKAYTYTYTIPGSMVKGDIITVTVEKARSDVWTLIKTGNGWADAELTYTIEDDATVYTAGSTIPKTAKTVTVSIPKSDKRTYTVRYGLDSTASSSLAQVDAGDKWTYTYTAGESTFSWFYLDITYTEKADFAADEVVEYLKLGTDASAKTMWLVLCSGKTNGYLTCSYGENTAPMYYSEKYQAWAYLVISGDNAEAVKNSVKIMNVDESAGKKTVDYSGDVNMTGGVDINDAQLIVNMYNADYTGFAGNVTMEKFLRADMDGSKAVDNADVLKIIAAVNN